MRAAGFGYSGAVKSWRCLQCGWVNPDDAVACADCDKPKPKAKTKRPPPSFRPWRVVVLALDPANRSGWAVLSMGRYVESGECRIYSNPGLDAVKRACESAASLARMAKCPWVVCAEVSWGGRMAVGPSQALGAWRYAVRSAGLPMRRVVEVFPSTWRARVLGGGLHAAKRDVVRKAEVVAASDIAGRTCGGDEAPAVLIGKWGCQAGEVGAVLPERMQKTV